MNSQQQDISMESPQKKATFGSAFGQSNTSSSFTFGQPAHQQSNGAFGFGSSQNGNNSAGANGGGLFGRISTPEDARSPSNPFAQPSNSQPAFGGFSQAAPAPQSPAPSFSFGQNNNSAAVPASTPSFSFGQSSSLPQSPLPSFGGGQGTGTQSSTEAPKFTFGQSSTTSQGPASGASFGAAAPSTTGSSSIFGSGSSSSGQTPTTGFGTSTTSAPFSFGQSQPASNQSNPFGGFGAAKSDETKATAPLFGSSATDSKPAAESQERSASPEKSSSQPSAEPNSKASTNPFASLFPGAGTPPIAPVSKPTFSFGAPSQPAASSETNTVSGASPTSKPSFSFGNTSQISTPSKPAKAESTPASKAPFSFGSTSQPYAQSTTDPKQSETKPSSIFSFGSKPASSDNAAIGQKASSPDVPVEQPGHDTAQSKISSSSAETPSFSFSAHSKPGSSGGLFSPEKNTTEGASNQQQGPTSNLFATTPKIAAEGGNAQAPSTPALFGRASESEAQQARSAPQSAAAKPSSERRILFQSNSDNQPQIAADGTNQSSSASEPAKRPVYTKAPPFIPSHLDAEQYREYDRNYRLHSLNAGLQRKLEKLDPRTHDFDNIIRHYVAARDSVGASLGLYTRNVAGAKRKGDRLDADDEGSAQNKRTRANDGQQVSAQSKPTSSLFGGGFTPQKSGSASTSDSSTTPRASGSSKAAARLSEMIPDAGPTSQVSRSEQAGQDTNPFQLNGPKSVAPALSTTPTKSPPKKPTFEVPKFGGGNVNFMNSFGQKAKENAEKFEQSLIEKRKAEDFDSDEDDEETFLKQAEEEMRAKRAKIDALSKGGFTPTFGSGNTSASTPPIFGSESKASPQKPSSSGSAPKNAKNPGSSKSGFSGFTAATSSSNPFSALSSTETSGDQSQQSADEEDDGSQSDGSNKNGEERGEESSENSDGGDEETEHDRQDTGAGDNNDEEDDGDDNDFQAALDRSRKHPNAGKSLFDRIEPSPNKGANTITNGEEKESGATSNPTLQPAKNSSFPSSVWGSHIGKFTPEAPTLSPITPATEATESSYKPSTTFSFTPTVPNTSSTPTPGASIFFGGLTKEGPVPGEGLFGSRPSTPSNVEKNNSLAQSILTSPAGTDNTWKQGAPISFANGEKGQTAPSFQFTAPSPADKDSSTAKPFGSLFGTASTAPKSNETPNQVGFQFGGPTSTPAPGFLGAITHLGGGSATSSAGSSRATSPGVTDNESVATNETDETPEEPQAASLMESRAGEENESCVWEGRSKALMFANQDMVQGTKLTPNDWNSMGVGQIRVLKDKSTGKTRVVFRVEPNANILINSHLIQGVTYENMPSSKSGAVRGALIYKGNLVRWVFKVKTPEMATELAKVMEDNKNAGA